MTRYKATLVSQVTDSPRSSVGGNAILPAGSDIRPCRNCGTQLLLFLQLDIDESWALPFKPRSHLVIFMCPRCNDIPAFNDFPDGKLPAAYWDTAVEGHFFAALFKPGDKEKVLPQEPLLVTKELKFSPATEEGHAPGSILVGGPPYWLQDPRRFFCSCGTEMALILQIAENIGFDQQPGAPPQPDSFSKEKYCLCLGNEIYVFGCPRQCNPRSVWITVQG